jgi:2-keto-4-pentenoate hydratase
MTIAAISITEGPPAQIAQGVGMRTDQVANVDVIANTSAIRGRIIGAVDCELGPKPERCFDGDLDKLGGIVRRLASVRQRGSAPATLK